MTPPSRSEPTRVSANHDLEFAQSKTPSPFRDTDIHTPLPSLVTFKPTLSHSFPSFTKVSSFRLALAQLQWDATGGTDASREDLPYVVLDIGKHCKQRMNYLSH